MPTEISFLSHRKSITFLESHAHRRSRPMQRLVPSALLILLAAGPATAQRESEQPGKYGWLSSLDAGKAEARRTGKPLMVAIRCVP
jgi:hypothetical protein